eukprot:GHVU01012704.1.p3 GENE.GHVU01012704.1~~GHVU01012704.1.p3  ORF type:complete len:155 (-),score=9.88 GHVU01012704.1:1239-1703(-)
MNSLLFRSGVRRAGGAAKPTWAVPKDKLGGPSMRDRAYALENPEYSGFTLWLRALRPYLQKALGDVATTLRGTATGVYTPLRNAWVAHNPDLRSVRFRQTAKTTELDLCCNCMNATMNMCSCRRGSSASPTSRSIRAAYRAERARECQRTRCCI